MSAATSAAAIEEIASGAKAAIDALKTDAQYTVEEEEIASNKAAALAVVNSAKASIDLSLYSQTDATTINVLYTQTKQQIENATTKEEMDAAAESFVAKLASIAPKAEDKSSGCGSVAGISGVFALLGVCAFVVACKKKED